VDAFDRLSPALQYQVVNSLGWTGLRPVQEQATRAILDGRNCVVLAPTAGGKTEAAFFPLLSLADTEDRRATSVLYIAPIRALLNNQEARLERLTGLVGRTSFKWHGDVGASARRRFIAEPADVLAITPESLEAMLMSTRVPGARILRNVRAVVIDEVHAFAGDDRGAHLSALLERITRICGNDIQRIGLSATVGDPEAIAQWLSGSSGRDAVVVDPGGGKAQPDLSLDYVGNLENAALMVERLHPGRRRLVFVDSRRRVEALGDQLRRRGVNTFLSHSSLAVAERAAAERAFEEENNCVIVATSALELGIDVGDLDHVLQLDAPSTVSSFLQRMGRTGRRAGTRPNCTFLATSEEAVLQAAALLRLNAAGYVEPTEPSARAPHVLAHQVLALGIQQLGVGVADWWPWLEGCASFAGLDEGERQQLVDHMLAEDIVAASDARLSLGRRGERLYAGRNFLELYAVFSTPPVLKVMHGNKEVGTVDAWFAQQEERGPLAFVLGGEPWEVVHIDWRRAVCRVKRAERGRYPSWMGRPKLLSRALCEAMRDVLVTGSEDPWWSRRARATIAEQRDAHEFLQDADRPLAPSGDKMKWWTFAGGKANALLAAALEMELGEKVTANNQCVTFAGDAADSDVAIQHAIRQLAVPGALTWEHARMFAPDAARGRISKFQPCLPATLETDLLARTLLDLDGALVALRDGTTTWTDRGDETSPLGGGDFAGFGQALPVVGRRKDLVRAEPKAPIHWVDTGVGLAELAVELANTDRIGLDVETTLTDQSLCLIQLATGDGTWLVDPLALDDLSPLRGVLAADRPVKVIHNAAFERSVLGREGLELGGVLDTLVESRRICGKNALGGHSLAMVCERELGLELDKAEQTSDWSRRPLDDDQVRYAALDAEVLLPLAERLT